VSFLDSHPTMYHSEIGVRFRLEIESGTSTSWAILEFANSMPTLGLVIGPKKWKSFHVDMDLCLACIEANERNYSTSH
jgi:hypothetical protein